MRKMRRHASRDSREGCFESASGMLWGCFERVFREYLRFLFRASSKASLMILSGSFQGGIPESLQMRDDENIN